MSIRVYVLTLAAIAVMLSLAGCREAGATHKSEAHVAAASIADAETPIAGRELDDDDDGDGDDDDATEEEIPLDQVPQIVKDAALAAVPGLVLEEAEKETENGVVIYCVEGEVGGVEYEVEVTPSGKILEVERDDDDDDDDD